MAGESARGKSAEGRGRGTCDSESAAVRFGSASHQNMCRTEMVERPIAERELLDDAAPGATTSGATSISTAASHVERSSVHDSRELWHMASVGEHAACECEGQTGPIGQSSTARGLI
jgi:hypothetical protein